MKNLKGCLKREDKPLFHHHDLARSVVYLCEIIRPTLNIIDCSAKTIRRQMGTGCVSDRQPSGPGLLIATPDIVAADAVACTLMGINPGQVRTVTLGAAAGLGESSLSRMDILGEEIKQLRFPIQMPREELRQKFPLLEIRGAEKACSGCLIPLLSSLSLLSERGIKLEKPLAICLGAEPEIPVRKASLLIGDCARAKGKDELHWVGGCPPSKDGIISTLIGRRNMNNNDEV
jgi:hypothetical protein